MLGTNVPWSRYKNIYIRINLSFVLPHTIIFLFFIRQLFIFSLFFYVLQFPKLRYCVTLMSLHLFIWLYSLGPSIELRRSLSFCMSESSVALLFEGGSERVNKHLQTIYYTFSNLLRKLSVFLFNPHCDKRENYGLHFIGKKLSPRENNWPTKV